MSKIMQDIIPQILCRLPSKSVARFRCVSKSWLSLLTNPKFIKIHHKTLTKRHHLIFANQDTPSRYDSDSDSNYTYLYSHPPSHDYDDPFILKPTILPIVLDGSKTFHGSCDGLVLASVREEDYYDRYFDTLILLNPTTRQSVQLPQPSYYPKKSDQEDFHTFSTHGVGYDSVTDDYKVITLTRFDCYIQLPGYGYRPRELTRTMIYLSLYSLSRNTWRQRQIIDSPYNFRYSPTAVYSNGCFHWVAKKDDNSLVIVAYSLANECFSEVPSPKIMPNCNCKLVVLGEKLAIYVFHGKYDNVKFTIWLMKEYGVKSSWTKIPLDIFDIEFEMVGPNIFDDNNGKIRVAGEGQVMLIYDLEKRTLSENAFVWSSKFRVFGSYVESLVSLPEQVIDCSTGIDDASSKGSEAGSYVESLVSLPEQVIDCSTRISKGSEAGSYVESLVSLPEQVIDCSTRIDNASSKGSEVDLPENLDPICHHFRNKCLQFGKILNDRKASLRKKERKEGDAKVKNKRRKYKKIQKLNLSRGGVQPHQ